MPKAGFAEWDENDAFGLYDERPSRHARKRRLPWLRMGFFSVLCVAVIENFAQEYEQKDPNPNQPQAVATSVPAPVLTAPTPVWRQIPPQPVLYAFERNADPVAMTARQHAGGTREDTLILGGFGEERYAHV